MNSIIKPGSMIYDTNGNPVQAHAARLCYINGKFYLYGEDKSNMTVDKPFAPYHNGVHCYSSDDLYNWDDEGIILAAVDDIDDPLDRRRILDRPHILYNEKTKKYVMWVKLAGDSVNVRDWKNQRAGVAVADSFTGPYIFIKDFLPGGMNMGDFDFVTDDDSGDVYIIFSHIVGNPAEMVSMKLTDDYLDVEGVCKKFFDYGAPPATRESPALFKRGGRVYLSTSGCTGYHPNPSSIAVSDSPFGEWEELGDICIGDDTRSTFHSQISCVFRHPHKKDLYIALGDRWLSDLDLSHLPWITEGYRTLQSKEPVKTDLTWEKVWQYSKRDISKATYVWLPLCFDDDGVPHIKWQDEWRIEDYE